MKVVGVELVRRDRASFDEWWPEHLQSMVGLVDHLYLRVDTEEPPLSVPTMPYPITVADQTPRDGRRHFRENVERQAALEWALDQEADWVVCFDADEVIHAGQDLMRSYMEERATMLWGVHLNYCSHHRPGYVLPRSGIRPWRGFRLTPKCHHFRYVADEDGLHSGSIVPHLDGKRKVLLQAKVLHHHAVNCEEFMAERAYYENTAEVRKHGGIDHLYRCDRFGNESEAVTIDEWLAISEKRAA